MDNIIPELLHMLQQALEKTPPILLLGVMVLIGAIFGELARRASLPRITGYFVAGVLAHLGLVGLDLGWPIHELVRDLMPLFEVALGFVLVEVGRRIQLVWLVRNKALFGTLVLESVLTFATVAALFMWLGVGAWSAVLVGAVATSTSPLVLHALIMQVRAEGQISDRALHIAAVNTMVAAVLVSALLPIANSAQPHLQIVYVLKPLAGLVLAAVIGTLSGRLLRVLLVRSRDLPYAWVCVIGAVSLMVGLAQWGGAPVVVSALAMGLSVSDAAQRRAATRKGMQPLQLPEPPALSVLMYVVLFLFAGAALPWRQWWVQPIDWPFVAALAVALLLARLGAKALGTFAMGSWSGLRPSQSVGLALALQPMTVTGLALYLQVRAGFPGLEPQAGTALLVALAVADLLTPLLVMRVLRSSGEAEVLPPRAASKFAPRAAEPAAARLREL
ncbi:MAG: cation:proton antiporter [Betaproteobacteria bacterium]|nr:cation:proton antiporter [Betaproteobacteria bacterium]